MNHDTWSVFCWFLNWDCKSLTSQREKKILILISFNSFSVLNRFHLARRSAQDKNILPHGLKIHLENVLPLTLWERSRRKRSLIIMPAICTVLQYKRLSLLFPGIFILCFQHWTAPKHWPLCTQLLAANK